MYLNKAILFGNLTRDPELKSLPSGMAVATFSIATNRRFKDKDGRWQETPDFHNIVVFGKQAETMSQYLRKGSSVFIEGRIQNRSWDDKDGQKKYRSEVVADRIQFGPKTGGSAGGDHSAKNDGGNDTQEINSGDESNYPENTINPDDIPF